MFTRLEAEALILDVPEWFGTDPEDSFFKAAVLLLLGIGRRKHLSDLTNVSNYPREFVQQCLRNAREGRIWKGEDKVTYADWHEEPLAFLLDAMVAEGRLVKSYQP